MPISDNLRPPSGDHSWVLRRMLEASLEAGDEAPKPNYPAAVGCADALITTLGILMRSPSDNPQRDLDEIRRATQDAAKRFKQLLGKEYREWDFVPHRLRVIKEG